MQRIGRIALLTLSIIGISFVLTLATSHKVRAAVSALVTVTNTRSTPVPNQDVDNAARHPYTATCYIYASGGAFATCQPTPAPPTTGYETVIQNVNVALNQDSGNVQPFVTDLDYSTASANFQFYIPLLTQAQGASGGEWIGNQPSAIYLDPSSYNPLQCASFWTNGSATFTCTVSGYTVSLP
jgi:hypothetical protein